MDTHTAPSASASPAGASPQDTSTPTTAAGTLTEGAVGLDLIAIAERKRAQGFTPRTARRSIGYLPASPYDGIDTPAMVARSEYAVRSLDVSSWNGGVSW